MADEALVPIEQKQVIFYEDEITAVWVDAAEERGIYVPVKQLCEHMGVAWPPQYRRIQRDEVLSAAATSITVTVTESGQRGAVVCLPLKYIPGFLFGITASRVKPALRDKIIRYRRECFDVLAEAFQDGRLTATDRFDELLAHDSPAAQAYKMAAAIMKMAQQQLLLEAQLETHETRLGNHEQRIEQIEAALGHADRQVTPEQAMQISQAVKSIAFELSKRSRRNEYGGVYGELYRRYGINSYKALPQQQYDDAMAWLNDWLQTLIGAAPF